MSRVFEARFTGGPPLVGALVWSALTAAAADLERLRAAVLERVAGLSRSEGLSDPEIEAARASLARLTGPVDVDAMRLPPNVSKTMARANMELQRMMKTLFWGDLAAYAKRLEALDAAALQAAARRLLDPKAATVVLLKPAP